MEKPQGFAENNLFYHKCIRKEAVCDVQIRSCLHMVLEQVRFLSPGKCIMLNTIFSQIQLDFTGTLRTRLESKVNMQEIILFCIMLYCIKVTINLFGQTLTQHIGSTNQQLIKKELF